MKKITLLCVLLCLNACSTRPPDIVEKHIDFVDIIIIIDDSGIEAHCPNPIEASRITAINWLLVNKSKTELFIHRDKSKISFSNFKIFDASHKNILVVGSMGGKNNWNNETYNLLKISGDENAGFHNSDNTIPIQSELKIVDLLSKMKIGYQAEIDAKIQVRAIQRSDGSERLLSKEFKIMVNFVKPSVG